MNSSGLKLSGSWVTILNGSRITTRCPIRRRAVAVSRAFSPLKSTTTHESGQVSRCRMTHDTPLPTPVGAKTAVWTAFVSRTRGFGGLRWHDWRNRWHAWRAGVRTSKSALASASVPDRPSK